MTTKLKILLQIFVLVLFFGIISMPTVYGAESSGCRSQSGGHCVNFAAAVPGLEFLGDATGLGDLLSRLFTFGMGFVGIAAFIMFMIGGVQYLVAGDKDPTEAKNRMKNAAIGLGVALISWLILFTINPDLVKTLSLNYLPTIDKPVLPESLKNIENITPIGGEQTASKCLEGGNNITLEGGGILLCAKKEVLENQKLGDLCGATFDLFCKSGATLCKEAGGKVVTLVDGPYCTKPFK